MSHDSNNNTNDSPILTSDEAARFLRLDDDYDDIGGAIEALLRLARDGKIRPIKGCGKKYKWHREELLRYALKEGLTIVEKAVV